RTSRASRPSRTAGTGGPGAPGPGTRTRSSAAAREDRSMPVYTYDPPDRFVAGAVGQPGERTFYLQASAAGRGTQVALEKVQVSRAAGGRAALLDGVLRRAGGQASVPATAPAELADDAPLDLPLMEEFRVGAIALAWDGEDERVVIEAQEETENPVEPLAEEVPEDGPGVLRVRITPAEARAFSQRALQVVAQGRPACPLCGLPLDAEGRPCPRQHGPGAGDA